MAHRDPVEDLAGLGVEHVQRIAPSAREQQISSGDTWTANTGVSSVPQVATGVWVATSMTVTVASWFPTYTVPPSGEKATPVGTNPVGMNPSIVRVRVLVIPTPLSKSCVK